MTWLSLIPHFEKWWLNPLHLAKREKSAQMMFLVFRIRIPLFWRPYSFFENFSSPSHEGNDPTSAWNIWNGFGNSGNRYVAPYAWRSTWIRLRSPWWVELLWLWLFFVEKKEAVEACWNIFLLEGITRYHPKQKKDMGQFSDSEFPLGKKVKPLSQTRPFLTRRLWQRWTNSWPGAQSKWCLGCVKIDYPSLKINLDARKNSCVWKEMKCFKLIICLGVYVKFPKEKWSVSGHYHEFFPQLQRPVFALRVSPSRVWLEMRGHQY